MMHPDTFPVWFRITEKARDELLACEYGSFEDADYPTEGHTVPILHRHKRKLEIRSQEEADVVYWAVCSGTFSIRFYRTACRLADQLRPYAKPETVKRWFSPTGL